MGVVGEGAGIFHALKKFQQTASAKFAGILLKWPPKFHMYAEIALAYNNVSLHKNILV